MNRMKKTLLLAATGAVLLFSTCKTDIDLLDDWKETTVVYGLLDQSQPKQYIRIQKAFLGEGNALSMAQVYDSINYINQLTVVLQEYSGSTLTNTFSLQPDTIGNKETGVFAAPNMVLYSTSSPLNASRTYKLIVTNSQTGNVVTSETPLVGNFTISSPPGSAVNITKINPTYKITIAWNGAVYGRIYQPAMRFYYDETDVNNVTVTRMLEWPLGTVKSAHTDGSDDLEVAIDPTDFYRFLKNNISVDPNVVSREADHADFVVYAGGDDLSTYMDVNAPSTSIVQERPIFTNIVDGDQPGVGLFSARYRVLRGPYSLSPNTFDTLAFSNNTCALKFKDRNGNIGFCQ